MQSDHPQDVAVTILNLPNEVFLALLKHARPEDLANLDVARKSLMELRLDEITRMTPMRRHGGRDGGDPDFGDLPCRTLACCPRLATVDVHNTPLRDLSPLSAVAGTLTSLTASSCHQLVDLTPLTALVGLTHLDLSDCRNVTGIMPLTALTRLGFLDCSIMGGVYDHGVVAFPESLHTLRCSHNVWANPARRRIRLPPALVELDLGFTECRSLNAVVAALGGDHLRWLGLEGNGLSDVWPLAAFVNLETLDVHGNWRIVVLPPLPRLVVLHCGNTLLDEAAVIATGALGLRTLHLVSCGRLHSLSPFSALTSLEELHLDLNPQLTTLTAIARLPRLVELSINQCTRLTSIAPLTALTALRVLSMERCHNVADLSTLAGLTTLRSLDVRGNAGVADLSLLSGLSSLAELDVTVCELTNVAPLARLSELTRLNFDGGGIGGVSDLVPLAGLSSSLRRLTVDRISDLWPLTALTRLTILEVTRVECVGVGNAEPAVLAHFWAPLADMLSLRHVRVHADMVAAAEAALSLTNPDCVVLT